MPTPLEIAIAALAVTVKARGFAPNTLSQLQTDVGNAATKTDLADLATNAATKTALADLATNAATKNALADVSTVANAAITQAELNAAITSAITLIDNGLKSA